MGGKRIIILDDDIDILDSMQMVLEYKGYHVQTLDNPRDLDGLLENAPDLLLVDLWMSGVNGADICRQLKANDKTKHIPVVIISANVNIKEISCTCHADGYIPKPFEIEYLLTTIQQFTQ
ncbi:MAG TPA: response regulator [Agriterribacter sp.]|nr:response regulator [Agriterribacter sp.]